MNIIEINNYRDFLSLEEKWNQVLSKCNHTVFSTWEWLSICWKHSGTNKRLIVLLAKDNGEIIGIAPLMYTVRTMFGLKRAKIEFMDDGVSDYNDFILVEKEDECVNLFIKHLNRFPLHWDCVDLSDISENSKALPQLNRIAKNVTPFHTCSYIQLPKTHTIFMDSLKRNQRRDIRRNLRRLEDKYKVEFTQYSGELPLDEEMNSFFDLHQKRWESKSLPGVFASQTIRNFHLEIAKKFFEKGWLGLFQLKVSGTPAAALYGFKYQSKYYDYLTGFDPKFFPYNVGNLLRSHTIGECIKEGFAEFDFLRGAEEYKNRWNTQIRFTKKVTLNRQGSFADIENWLYSKYWDQGKRIKCVLKINR